MIFIATRRTRAYWPSEVAEAEVIAVAVRLGQIYGLKEVILESDCKLLITRLSKEPTYLTDLDSVLDDILATSVYIKYVI